MAMTKSGLANATAEVLTLAIPETDRAFTPARVIPFVTPHERDVRRAALSVAMRTTKTTGGQIALAWRVSETVVSRVRRGQAPLTDERVAKLPARVREAYGAALALPVQLLIPGVG